MAKQVKVCVLVLRVELLKDGEHTHDEPRTVAFQRFLSLSLHDRACIRAEVHRLKGKNSQKGEHEWKLLQLLAEAVDLVHRVDKACLLYCLSDALEHVFKVLRDDPLAVGVWLVELLVQLLLEIDWSTMGKDGILFDFVQVVQHRVVQRLQAVLVLSALASGSEMDLSSDELSEKL